MVSDETGKILSKITTSETKTTYAIVAVPLGKGDTFFSKYPHLFLYILGVNSFLVILLSIPIKKPKTAKI